MDHIQENQWHPESPERLVAIKERMDKEGLWVDVARPGPADPKDVLRVHTEEYIDFLSTFGEGRIDPDAYLFPETFDIAMLAAGGGVEAGDRAYNGDRVMALLRPPGHHALPFKAMGFCYLNNIAISAERLVASKGCRVAIVDLDLHHGNGTNDHFWERDDVLFISAHQYPHYPGTGGIGAIGDGKGKGFTVNLPFPGGCGDSTYVYAFDRLIEPIITQFKPDILMVSFGGDSLWGDPLGSLALSTPGYIGLASRLRTMAKDLCEGRLAYFLEGGYNVEPLAELVAGIVADFSEKDIELRFGNSPDTELRGRAVVDKVASTLEPYWKL